MATQDKNLLVLNAGQIEKAAGTDTIQVYGLVVEAGGASIGGDTTITGDLTVTGSIVSTSTTDVVIRDQFLDLAFGNTTDTAKAGGFTVSHNRATAFVAETVTDFTAGGAGAPTFTVSGGSTNFAAGDIVAITGATDADNNGLFVVASVSSGVVTIKGTGGTAPSASVPFVQTQFTAGTGQSASAYKVDLSAAAFADGSSAFKDGSGASWGQGTFVTAHALSATEGDFTGNGDWDSAAQTSLQEAYVTGNTITTSAGEGNVVVTGTEKLEVTATNGVQITTLLDLDGSMDADVTSYDVASTGAYTVTAVNASSISTSGAGQDLTLDAQAASLVLDGGEAAADAVRIVASAASGGIDIDAGTGGITVDSTGKIDLVAATASKFEASGDLTVESKSTGITYVKSAVEVEVGTLLLDVNATGAVTIDAAAASNFTVAGFDLTLSTTTAGDINIVSVADVDVDGATVNVDATGAVSIQGGAASDFTVSTGDLSLTATASSVNISGGEAAVDAVKIDATAGGIDINAGSSGITLDTSGALSLDSTALASNLSLTANSGSKATLTIAATNTGAGVADLDVDADGDLTVDAVGALSLDGGPSSNLSATGGQLTVSTITSGVLAVTSAGNLDMDAAGTVTIDSSGDTISIGSGANAFGINIGTGAAARTITVGNTTGATALDVNLGTGGMAVDTEGGGISLDAKGASNFTVDGANLTLSTATSGNLVATSVQLVDINAGTDVEIDAALGVSIDALKASNFTVTGSGESLTLAAAGGGAQQLILGSAGTGANAVRVNANAGGIDIDASTAGITVDTTGVLSLDGGDTTNLTMTANAAGPGAKALTIEAANTGAGGANVVIKAKSIVQLGDSALGTAFIEARNFLVFFSAAGLDAEAGEALLVGDAVVVKWDAGASKHRYFKAANNAAADVNRNVHGIAQTAAGAAGNIFKLGTVPGTVMSTALSGLATTDVAKPVFIGAGGALTLTAPTSAGTSVFRVGFVSDYTSGKVLFQPQFIAKIL